MRLAVIGAGGWGTALAKVLVDNEHEVLLWAREPEVALEINQHHLNSRFLSEVGLPEKLQATEDLQQAVDHCEALVMAVPSQWTRVMARQVAPLISRNTIVINVSKGLEITTQKRLTEVLEEELPIANERIVALSGPNHAEEVARGVPSATVVASPDQTIAETVQDIFMNSSFRVYTNADRTGVELGGALKNIIALAGGITDGLGFGDNTKAALITRGIAEMARLGVAMGALSQTFAGLSGLGDLFVTASSRHSRNSWAGREIGSGRSPEEVFNSTPMVVEGAPTSKAAYLLSKQLQVEMPITTKVYEVLYEGASPIKGVKELMERGRTHESEEVARLWAD